MITQYTKIPKQKDNILSIIVVVNNLEKILNAKLTLLIPVLLKLPNYELLIIDNGSIDNSGRIIKKYQAKIRNIRFLKLSKNYDIEIALSAGLENAIGDYIVFFDINLDPPTIISLLYKKAQQGYDIVTGKPLNLPKFSLWGNFIVRINNMLLRKFVGIRADYYGTYTRILSRKAVNSLLQIKNRGIYFNYFNYIGGHRNSSISYEVKYIQSKYYPKVKSLKYLISSIDFIISNSTAPLRLTSLICFLASLSNLLFIAYSLIVTLIKSRSPEGWLTTSFMNGIMFFLLFFILSIISEYLVRIVYETRERPSYFMFEEYNAEYNTYSNDKMNVV